MILVIDKWTVFRCCVFAIVNPKKHEYDKFVWFVKYFTKTIKTLN